MNSAPIFHGMPSCGDAGCAPPAMGGAFARPSFGGGSCGSGSCGTGGGCGIGLGGLASGCSPLGGLGLMRNRFGCGVDGYHPQAFEGPGIAGAPVNPYGMHPGVGPDGGFINLGDTCCGPHWYDIMVQTVFLQRDRDRNIGLTSDGARGMLPPNIILSTGDLDFDLNTAIRVAGRLQLSATTSMEAIYLGGLDWDDSQSVFNNFDNLFSVYSDFGADPLGGFQDTDQAIQHTATIDTDFDSAELSFRSSWVSQNYRSSGSWMIGGRYIRLRDNFQYFTLARPHTDPFPTPPIASPGGQSQYDVSTENDLVGLQIGTDANFCLCPGLQIGAEAKAAVYGNSVEQQTAFSATTANFQLAESVSNTEIAYSTEAQVFLLWQVHPLAKIRAGYEVLFLDGVATGFGNFNTANPFLLRNPVLNEGDDLLLHGFNVGMEFGW